MASNQVEEHHNRQSNRHVESVQMAQRDFPRLVQLFINNNNRVNFTETQQLSIARVYLKMRFAMQSIFPMVEYWGFLRTIRNRSLEDKIMEFLIKLLIHVTDYMMEQQGLFCQAANWFNRTNTLYLSQNHGPSEVFFFLQGAFADICRYYHDLRAMRAEVARHRKLVEYLCSVNVIPEQHNRPLELVPAWRARQVVRFCMGMVRQFEFQCELLATLYHLLLVRSLMDLRQNA